MRSVSTPSNAHSPDPQPFSDLWVTDLPWDVVAGRMATGAPAILPIGAGAKQHGWHLPMGADHLQASWLAERLAARIGGLVWPVVSYGHYPAFTAYAGSLSLSEATFAAMISETIAGLLAHEARRVLVLDTGISTQGPVGRAIAGLPDPRRVVHLRVYAGAAYRAEAARDLRQPHGGHADELETSCLMAIAPRLVSMDRAAASPAIPPGPGPMQHADPTSANYSASGSIGDPTGASAGKGEGLLAAMLRDLVDAVQAAAD